MEFRKTLIALDIDGTLKGYGGLIGVETIRRLLHFAHVGIVSSRGDTHEIARRLGLGFASIGKSTALREYAERYSPTLGKLYIADTEEDKAEAEKAGWNYVNANNIKLNLGCGNDIRRGYVNIDCREIQGIDLCYDMRLCSIPFEDETASEILLKDSLEHLSWRIVKDFLKDCYRVLKKNGKIHIQCPDLEAIARKVILNPDFRFGELHGHLAIGFWVYGSGDYGEPSFHKAGFTIPTLKKLLEELGFKVIDIHNDGGTNIICQAVK